MRIEFELSSKIECIHIYNNPMIKMTKPKSFTFTISRILIFLFLHILGLKVIFSIVIKFRFSTKSKINILETYVIELNDMLSAEEAFCIGFIVY